MGDGWGPARLDACRRASSRDRRPRQALTLAVLAVAAAAWTTAGPGHGQGLEGNLQLYLVQGSAADVLQVTRAADHHHRPGIAGGLADQDQSARCAAEEQLRARARPAAHGLPLGGLRDGARRVVGADPRARDPADDRAGGRCGPCRSQHQPGVRGRRAAGAGAGRAGRPAPAGAAASTGPAKEARAEPPKRVAPPTPAAPRAPSCRPRTGRRASG